MAKSIKNQLYNLINNLTMINKFSITLFTTLLLLSLSSSAQLKDLSFEEIFNKPANDILNPLPVYRGWADNTHYIEYRMRLSKASLILSMRVQEPRFNQRQRK